MPDIRRSTSLLFAFLLAGTFAVPASAQESSSSIQALLSGFGAMGYSSTASGEQEHDFTATTSLVTLFQIERDILVEGELELALHEGETLAVLEHAEVHYLGFDRLQLTAGKFHVPFGVWMHPNWINRMPMPPLLYEDAHGEAPTEALLPILFDVGGMAHWNVPVADGWRTSVGAWVTQGPKPGEAHAHDETEHEEEEEEHDSAAPLLSYGSNYEDNNSDKMLGLQLRAVSAGGLTLQLSGFHTEYDDEGALDISAGNAAFVWNPRSGPLQSFDFRGEGALLNQEYIHDNEVHTVRYGGYYLQGSRRMGPWEPVLRWSHLPEAMAGEGHLIEERRQLALGLDYWISPSVPVKAAFAWELDGINRLFIEWAVGF